MNTNHFQHMHTDPHFSLSYIFKGTEGNFNLKLTVSVGFALQTSLYSYMTVEYQGQRESSMMYSNVCEVLDIVRGDSRGSPI